MLNEYLTLKEKITNFEDEIKIKSKIEKYRKKSTKIESFGTFVINATTSNSITSPITGLGKLVISTSTGEACDLS